MSGRRRRALRARQRSRAATPAARAGPARRSGGRRSQARLVAIQAERKGLLWLMLLLPPVVVVVVVVVRGVVSGMAVGAGACAARLAATVRESAKYAGVTHGEGRLYCWRSCRARRPRSSPWSSSAAAAPSGSSWMLWMVWMIQRPSGSVVRRWWGGAGAGG